MMLLKAIPYKKEFDKYGVLLNPITRANPYLHDQGSFPRYSRRGSGSSKDFTGPTSGIQTH